MKTAACSSCGNLMIWTLSERGARMPVDAEPSSDGTFVLDDTLDPPRAKFIGQADREIRRALAEEQIGYAPVFYVSHFAHCPYAGQHRKKARA